MQNVQMTQADNSQKQMKKHLLILLFTAALTIPAEAQEYPKYQFNFGWGGLPFLEWAMYGTPPFIDVKIDPVDSFLNLNQIYHDSTGPTWSTGTFGGEFAINYRKWFTLSIDMAANVTWCNSYDAVTGKKTETDRGFFLHVLPQARFNWLNRNLVRMYSSIGIGAMTGMDLESDEFLIAPSAQINPVGIEIGRKLFGFCEAGFGTMYSGAMAGIGYRF